MELLRLNVLVRDRHPEHPHWYPTACPSYPCFPSPWPDPLLSAAPPSEGQQQHDKIGQSPTSGIIVHGRNQITVSISGWPWSDIHSSVAINSFLTTGSVDPISDSDSLFNEMEHLITQTHLQPCLTSLIDMMNVSFAARYVLSVPRRRMTKICCPANTILVSNLLVSTSLISLTDLVMRSKLPDTPSTSNL